MAEADSEWSTTIFRDCRKPSMPRPLRFVPENGLVEITTRTLQGRLLLRPSPELNDLILGVIGRAQDRYGMVIHAFVVTSNHAPTGWCQTLLESFLSRDGGGGFRMVHNYFPRLPKTKHATTTALRP